MPQNYMGSAWDAVLDPRQADVRNGKKFFPSRNEVPTHIWLEWNFEGVVYFGQTVLANVFQV